MTNLQLAWADWHCCACVNLLEPLINDRNGESAGIVYIKMEATVLPQHISTQNAQHIALMLLHLSWAGLLQHR